MKRLLLLFIPLVFFFGCEPDGEEIQGCTDETACNYNIDANTDDGGCMYPGDSFCIASASTPQPGWMVCTWNEICEDDCVLGEGWFEEDCL